MSGPSEERANALLLALMAEQRRQLSYLDNHDFLRSVGNPQAAPGLQRILRDEPPAAEDVISIEDSSTEDDDDEDDILEVGFAARRRPEAELYAPPPHRWEGVARHPAAPAERRRETVARHPGAPRREPVARHPAAPAAAAAAARRPPVQAPRRANRRRSSSGSPVAAMPRPPKQQRRGRYQDIAGPFVTNILSGDLLSLDRERNTLKAVDAIVRVATGTRGHIPPTITLSERQLVQVAENFLDDRSKAVLEGVKHAYYEMKANHESILQPPVVPRTSARDERNKAKAAYEGKVKELEKKHEEEIAALRKQLESSQAQTAKLKHELKDKEGRQERSISAFMKASVHSLRLLRGRAPVEEPEKEQKGK